MSSLAAIKVNSENKEAQPAVPHIGLGLKIDCPQLINDFALQQGTHPTLANTVSFPALHQCLVEDEKKRAKMRMFCAGTHPY
jgi:hypothetical protein